jgi:hypothetical protein
MAIYFNIFHNPAVKNNWALEHSKLIAYWYFVHVMALIIHASLIFFSPLCSGIGVEIKYRYKHRPDPAKTALLGINIQMCE